MILGKNWLTTLVGLIAAVANALLPLLEGDVISSQVLLQSAVYAALGWAAKSFNVTGK